MKKIIVFLFIIVSSGVFSLISQGKYIKENDITIAKINIDTIIPEVKLMNIQNIMYKENENNIFDVVISIKIVENNIRENNINNMKISIDNLKTEDIDIKNVKNESDKMEYEVKIKRLYKNQKIKVFIPQGVIIDNHGNESKDLIIEHEIN